MLIIGLMTDIKQLHRGIRLMTGTARILWAKLNQQAPGDSCGIMLDHSDM